MDISLDSRNRKVYAFTLKSSVNLCFKKSPSATFLSLSGYTIRE
jgi:hypothetical protein